MLKYTVAAVTRIVNDLKLAAHVATTVMQSFMLVYLIISMILGSGSLIINGVLLALSAVNLAVYLFTYGRTSKLAKRAKSKTATVCRWAKLFINAISLVSVIYSIWATTADVPRLTLVLTPITLVLWVVQVAIEVIRIYATRRFAYFVDALKMDFEFVTKPVTKARNFLHDFIGEEREDEDTVSPENRERLIAEAGVIEEKKKGKPKNIVSRAFSELGRRIKAKFGRKTKQDKIEEAEPERQLAAHTDETK
ncbi:MAG: hypothetical protein IKC32_06010 [Clostridia bacterium]|nr:hypothetical protein [Clostridia bacterium]